MPSHDSLGPLGPHVVILMEDGRPSMVIGPFRSSNIAAAWALRTHGDKPAEIKRVHAPVISREEHKLASAMARENARSAAEGLGDLL